MLIKGAAHTPEPPSEDATRLCHGGKNPSRSATTKLGQLEGTPPLRRTAPNAPQRRRHRRQSRSDLEQQLGLDACRVVRAQSARSSNLGAPKGLRGSRPSLRRGRAGNVDHRAVLSGIAAMHSAGSARVGLGRRVAVIGGSASVIEPAIPDAGRCPELVSLSATGRRRTRQAQAPTRTNPRSAKSCSDAMLPSVITAPTSFTPCAYSEPSENSTAARPSPSRLRLETVATGSMYFRPATSTTKETARICNRLRRSTDACGLVHTPEDLFRRAYRSA